MLYPHHTNREHHDISLILSYAPIGLIRATNTLIGLDSICVDTGCISLNDNSEVEIVLSIRRGERAETHRIRAEVSGRDEHGVRLRFRDCARATLEALLPYNTRH
jgi:hypothetical protein